MLHSHSYMFQDVGTELLCKGLYNQGNGLVTLVLWNNQITYQSMDSMAGALVRLIYF